MLKSLKCPEWSEVDRMTDNEKKAALEREAKFYDNIYHSMPITKLEPESQTWAWWESYLGPIKGRSVLDCGAGKGHHAIQFALAGASKVVAVDISEASCSRVLALARINKVQDQVEAVCYDLASIDEILGPESIDVAWGQAILHHISVKRFSTSLFSVLKWGGRGLFRENWAVPALMFMRNRVLPALGITRSGSPDEEPLSAKELSYLNEVFSGNVRRIVERFVFFSSFKGTSLGYRPLVTFCKFLDDLLY